MESLFGEVIYAYTRKQALEDGFQIDISEMAREAGIKFPVFITRDAFDLYAEVPQGLDDGQSLEGRLWDIVWMTRYAISSAKAGQSRIKVVLHVRNDRRRPKEVELAAVCSAMDIDDPKPAITIMLPNGD